MNKNIFLIILACFVLNISYIKKIVASSNEVDISQQNELLNQELLVAAQSWDINKIRKLIHNGANVNCKDRHGLSPLHYAAYKCNKDAIELLLEKGAAISAQSLSKFTPLHCAARSFSREILEVLINSGNDIQACIELRPTDGLRSQDRSQNMINAKTSDGDTVLHLIAASRYCTKDIIEYLLDSGANRYIKNNNGATPADLANNKEIQEIISYTPIYKAVVAQDYNKVSLLIRAGANLNAQYDNVNTLTKLEDTTTPVHVAIAKGNLGIIRLLVLAGASVNAKDHKGDTPLNIAVEKGREAYGNFLSDSFNKYRDIVELLIENGADKTIKNNKGERALTYIPEIRELINKYMFLTKR